MRGNKRPVNQIVAMLLLASLGVALVGGGSSGASAKATPPSPNSQTQQTQQTQRQETLVMRVYFRDIAERDMLAAQLSPEEVATTGGFLTVISDRPTYLSLIARGL